RAVCARAHLGDRAQGGGAGRRDAEARGGRPRPARAARGARADPQAARVPGRGGAGGGGPRAAPRRLLPARGGGPVEPLRAGRRAPPRALRRRRPHRRAARARARRADRAGQRARAARPVGAGADVSGADEAPPRGRRERRRTPSLASALAGATLLVVLGFALGVVGGLVMEEPDLLLDYVL